MHICLIRPPAIVPVGAYVGSLTPPIGLAYLAGSLKKSGHKVKIIDSVGSALDSKNSYGEKLLRYGMDFDEIISSVPVDCDIIGISGMFSSEWNALVPLYKMICQKFKNKFIVAGGEHFTAAPEISMNYLPGLNAIALGEGEETIVQLVECIEKNGDLNNVSGLFFRKSKTKFVKTAPRLRLRQINDIPWPEWDGIPLEEYLSRGYSYGVNRGRSMPMIASRGCPYSCTFCSNPLMWGTRWVARDVKDVVDEIEYYISKYKITNVDFYDLTAIVKKKWIIEFCEELINRKINITWQLPSGTRSEAIDKEVTPLLYESGCRNMNYAPESGSAKILTVIKKKIKLPNLHKSLMAANKSKINVKMNIIIGLPQETHLDIWKTLWSLVIYSFYGAYDVSIGIFAPYPGSELYSQLVEKKRITHDTKFWDKLSYVDITKAESYNDKISANWLMFYNWFGIILFYSSNYLFRPHRLIGTIKNLNSGKHESRGEMALSQIISRIKLYTSSKKIKA